jgi:hypothetical protein
LQKVCNRLVCDWRLCNVCSQCITSD